MEPALTGLPSQTLRIADLSTRRPTPFDLSPDADGRAAVAAALGIDGVKKLRFAGELVPEGRSDWRLRGDLGATVVQPCIVTLDPVTTRIDEPVLRHYIADLPAPEGGEDEMPEDDSQEPLPAAVDLGAVMLEALSLALPAFPRADGAKLGQSQFAGEGIAPMDDDDAKPFAGLAGLRDSLSGKDE